MKTRFLIIATIGVISTMIGIFLYQHMDSQNFKYPIPGIPNSALKDDPAMTGVLPDANSSSFEFDPKTTVPSGGYIKPLDILTPSAPWNNYDEFAQILVNATNDTIIEKRIEDKDHIVYTTQKGNLIISKKEFLEYSRLVDYSLQDSYAVPKEAATQFVNDFLDKIGYQRDGSEWIENTDYGSYLKHQFQQRKDGWIINNEITQFAFWPDSTYIYLGRWYHNTDAVKLHYSQDDAKKIAYDYARSLDVSELQECGFVAVYPEYGTMEIMNGSFVYSLASGSCKKEAWQGHYPYIEVLVDALDGNIVGWRYGPLA